jgi:methylase of polypeptide subunit release factors
MFTPISSSDARTLRDYLQSIEYLEPKLRTHLGVPELPSRALRNEARLLDRTSEPTPLNTMLRWFWLGLAQPASSIESLIPSEVTAILLQSGLLTRAADELVPTAMLLPFGDFLIASDHPRAFERKQPELVLWPNPTSRFLGRFAIRNHSRATLDLGTGSGILSLDAARFSDLVVGTDLNQRAVSCAQFNATLNAVENCEFLAGDCFEPVRNRTFDLILSNPPFFITPKNDYLFCDNPMELDGLCRRIVKEAPAYLNEGGYMEMLCEWAQVKGQGWEERIAEWLDGVGCDAWVMKGLTQDPGEYAQIRIRETSIDRSSDAESYRGYMNYYRHRGVEAIHDGLIVMRRRDGNNFFRIEEVPKNASGDLGHLVVSTFAAHDLLRACDTDDRLMDIRPRLADSVRLEQVCVSRDGAWHAESVTLLQKSGFLLKVDIQPLVAEFLSGCDGTRTVGQLAQEFAQRANAPLEKVQPECLGMIRKLTQRGFLVAV